MTDHAHSGAGFPGPAAPEPKAAPKTNILYSEKFRAIIYQIVLIATVVGIGYYLISNTLANLEQRGIQSGFGFLDVRAGFDINDSLIEYSNTDT